MMMYIHEEIEQDESFYLEIK